MSGPTASHRHGRGSPSAADGDDREGAARRVADVHRQARPTLLLAATFTVAAAVAALVPDDLGRWAPLHLFLVGGLLSAISAAAPLLAVTWSASPAPRPRHAAVQRGLLAGGALTLVVGRAADAPRWFTGAGGVAVLAAVVLLARMLVTIRRRATVPRFLPAIDCYLTALALGLVGGAGGVAMVAGTTPVPHAAVLDAHLTLNLFGLVGVVIGGTLPPFAAVQARTRTSARATPTAVRVGGAVLATATVAAAAGHLWTVDVLVAAGMGTYAAGVVGIAALLPRLGRRQFRWAGPRLVQLLTGIAWWAVCAVLLAWHALGPTAAPPTSRTLVALAVGGYAQILVASLAYFGPVLRGGGHRALSAGFAATRSIPSLVAGNVAAVLALAGAGGLLAGVLALWGADVALRARAILRPAS